MTKKKLTKKTVKKAVKKTKKKVVKLTKEQAKVVEIMQDAISQLRVEAFVASPGTYVGYKIDSDIYDITAPDNKELKSFLPKLITKRKPCISMLHTIASKRN